MADARVEEKQSAQERRFFEAIDRILAGKPLEKTLKESLRRREAVALNVTNVALEAGFARTYLYKNRAAMERVWARISSPQSRGSDKDAIIRELRDSNAKLLAERNLAIDAARRCMQETIRANENSSKEKAKARLSQENVRLQARIAHLEGEVANLRARLESGNIIPFRP
ncbi:hypothetical protein [Bosea sp. (in: a-proteobacteria)]|jgi:chromosome segregation ATPase|uniref:hypothetical protein n=1 Tax=Bosea sp. (in: a-proteobacteria) TaxID=1871050 RepID=UPI002DDD0585|nr:hypothetical protein [Bosea sp. (in: a-proteobacteria)]HEV2512666.1 hypothetical protein [Bosea sp. (in: a-proteobacteria)]